jgi:hypothetical protein
MGGSSPELLCQAHKFVMWMAMTHDTDVESEVPDFVQRPPYCRIDPRLFVAEGAATQSGEKHLAKEALARGNETARTRVFDIVRGYAWPGAYTGRALRDLPESFVSSARADI